MVEDIGMLGGFIVTDCSYLYGVGSIPASATERIIMSEALCYKCKFHGSVAGDTHSCCNHPEAGLKNADPLLKILAISASVTTPVISPTAKKLGIQANQHGVMSGWFNWPFNFDPIWLTNCKGFEEKDV